MPYLLYVGNYPYNYEKDELLFLFRDFTVRVERMICQGSTKTFALVTCKDINQARLIMKALNGMDVCGRKLIIKPPRNHQVYLHIPELGKDEDADVEYLYGPKVEKVAALELTRAYSGRKSRDCGNSSKDQETFDKKNSINLKSSQSAHQYVIGENESHRGHWVRITNFPIGMGVNMLSNLFSRHGAKDVKIIRKNPRLDGKLTEAWISLASKDAVRDAVKKFDHIYFWGEIISVEDVSNAGPCAAMHI